MQTWLVTVADIFRGGCSQRYAIAVAILSTALQNLFYWSTDKEIGGGLKCSSIYMFIGSKYLKVLDPQYLT